MTKKQLIKHAISSFQHLILRPNQPKSTITGKEFAAIIKKNYITVNPKTGLLVSILEESNIIIGC